MSARESIAYLRGLIEGQNIAENAGISKFNEALLSALDAIVSEIEDVSESCEDLRDDIDSLDEGFDELSNEIDGIGEELDEIQERHGHICGCGDDDELDEYDLSESEYESVTCPSCGKAFLFQPDAYDDDEDEPLCPHCGEPIGKD